MNVVFWLSIVTVLVLVWFLLSFAFGSIGTLFYRLFSDAKEEINKEYFQKDGNLAPRESEKDEMEENDL